MNFIRIGQIINLVNLRKTYFLLSLNWIIVFWKEKLPTSLHNEYKIFTLVFT